MKIAAVLLLLAATAPASAEVRGVRVFSTPGAAGNGEGEPVLRIEPEYRTRLRHLRNMEVSGTVGDRLTYAEQRLRLDVTMALAGRGGVFVQADLLDGVLYGDNGEFGREPEVHSGLAIASKFPNEAAWGVGLLPGGDPLDQDDYGPVLRPVRPLALNFAYGEVLLPVGLLRVGRQPITERGGVPGNDGRTGRNRWGASSFHEAVDRIGFGTSLSEAVRYLLDPAGFTPSGRRDQGVFLSLAWDFLVEDDPAVASDDLQQLATMVSFLDAPGRGPLRDLELTAIAAYRWEERFDTAIWSFPLRAGLAWSDLDLRFDGMIVSGATRELSAGLAQLTATEPKRQEVRSYGFEVEVSYPVGPVTFLAQWAFASGDDDPRPGDPLTGFTWPRDTNLGLLLFEDVLAFESARSAAVGIDNLEKLDSESFPLTEVATEGRVSNVDALFPQVFWDVVPGLRAKAGLLLAWADRPVTDPIRTLLAWDGDAIGDDALNYHGGRPSKYWGTELDLGLEWRHRDLFEAVVEAAWLRPGSALEDENGDALDAFSVETRFTFAFGGP